MGGKLTDVDVQFISLVKKGANKQPITIYKSASDIDSLAEPNTEPVVKEEAISQEEVGILKSLVSAIRNVLPGKKETVAKSQDINNQMDYTSFLSRINNPERNFDTAISALQSAVWNIFWDSSIEDGKTLILQNIDQFKSYVESLLNAPVDIQKAFFKKADEGSSGGENKEGGEDMTTEELSKALEPIAKAMEGINGRLDTIEKKVNEEVPAQVEKAEGKVDEVAGEVKKTEEKTEEVKKSADDLKDTITKSLETITKSLEGIDTRLSTLENVKGISKGLEGQEISKSNDPWAGVLDGI